MAKRTPAKKPGGVKPRGKRRPGPRGGTLQDWAPGQSGNPNGRPAWKELRNRLLDRLEGLKGKKATGEQIIDDLLRMARRSVAAQKLIWNYVEGLPKQTIAIEGDLGLTVEGKTDDMWGAPDEE